MTTYSNKEIWHVTYPIFLGLIAQNVINVTDTAFLGHVSEVALGAAAWEGCSISVFIPWRSDSVWVRRY